MKIKTALALLSLLASVGAHAGARSEGTVIMSQDPAGKQIEEELGFADAIVAGDKIYLSGVVAGVHDGETDLTIVYARAFDRIGDVLKSAGASWDDVVDITSYHIDLDNQMRAISEVKNRYVKAPFPAWTAVQVSRLIPPNGITEIKIVANVPKAKKK